GRAIRVTAREEARALSESYCPEIMDKYHRQLEAYKLMPQEELFVFQEVKVQLKDCDMPGRPIRRVQCSQCGDWVQDCRELEGEGKVLCRACAGARYYQVVDSAA
ncbi:MAG TPA: formylmethanofuran dehydrogenase, partial [Myxococcota bacterium]|nr:formylmethanofuran dehydrogenase [Myxococcota bacterium]